MFPCRVINCNILEMQMQLNCGIGNNMNRKIHNKLNVALIISPKTEIFLKINVNLFLCRFIILLYT